MPAPLKNRPIATWNAGDTVQGFAYLKRREVRQDRSGRDYLDLEIADASGSILGRAWSDSSALSNDFSPRGYVKFRGLVQSYRDQLQIKVDQCRQATEEDRPDGFDESALVPSTKFDLADLEKRLRAILDGAIERPFLHRLAAETLEVHGAALLVHPAAKGIHHAFRGGLLEHVVSMLELALHFASHYRELDRDLLLTGVLFHDLGKIYELGAMPDNDYTPVGRLVGHVVLGRDLLRERAAAIPDFPAELLLQLEHLVLSHQGRKEFASPVEPMTAEALALHAIDDIDSKLAVVRGLKAQGHGFVWARSLERFVWLGDGSAGPDTADAGSDESAEGTGDEVDAAGSDAPPARDQKSIW